jgi:stage II sporulation protein M
MVVGIAVTYFWSLENLPGYLASLDEQEMVKFQDRISNAGGVTETAITAPYLFIHNVQATLAIGFFGMFSFGVLAVILYLINTSVIGGLFGFFKLQGLEILPLFVNGILPHGIFEIPALILSCAAVLHVGLILVTPQEQRTIGDVLLEALADWARVYIGVVVPLLAIAAVMEAYVTPLLLLNAMK